MKKNKAFSLVELSVVILIIGILIAGVTQSGRLIRQIKLSTARSLTSSSDVASIRDVTAWFEATTAGVFTDINGNTDIDDKSKLRAWRDVNPQKSISDKPIMTNGTAVDGSTNNTEPKYIISGINGLPSVYFDGGAANGDATLSDATGDLISTTDTATMPILALDKTYSMFAVFRSDKGKAQQNAIIAQIGNGSDITAQSFASIGLLDGDSTNNSKPGFVTSEAKATSWVSDARITDYNDYIVGALVDFITPTSPADASVKLFVNSLTPVTYVGGDTRVATTIGAAKFVIGASNHATASKHFTGMISEVIVFDRKIKDEEAQGVMKYLRKKYNINN